VNGVFHKSSLVCPHDSPVELEISSISEVASAIRTQEPTTAAYPLSRTFWPLKHVALRGSVNPQAYPQKRQSQPGPAPQAPAPGVSSGALDFYVLFSKYSGLVAAHIAQKVDVRFGVMKLVNQKLHAIHNVHGR
jgi:hypothetical protein